MFDQVQLLVRLTPQMVPLIIHARLPETMQGSNGRATRPAARYANRRGPLTVQDVGDAIHGLDGDVEIMFGSTLAGKELRFFRFKWRGKKLLQIELNEDE
jgi:hypothetical protein